MSKFENWVFTNFARKNETWQEVHKYGRICIYETTYGSFDFLYKQGDRK